MERVVAAFWGRNIDVILTQFRQFECFLERIVVEVLSRASIGAGRLDHCLQLSYFPTNSKTK